MTKEYATSKPKTCYLPLEIDPQLQSTQFRIATILPGEWSDPIRCDLSVHSLQNPPPYETISYAWGDSNDTNKILIGDVELTIPNSLWLCLRHLRNNQVGLALWTDAVCINQTDLEERAAQVMMMGEIYPRCENMYIWFGEPGPWVSEVNHAFGMFLHWAEDRHFFEYPGFSRVEGTGDWVFRDNDAYRQMYEVFVDLVARPWWTRLWCVQEIALCPRAVVVLGGWRMEWATVLRARDNYFRHAVGCCEGVSDALPARYTYFLDHMLFLSQRFDVADMDQLVRSLRHKLCKDPRDKIYGLLGLLPRAGLQASYSIPVRKLYQDVTEIIISQANGDLQFLTGSGLGSRNYDLPSWIRDFAAPLSAAEASHEYTRYKAYALYKAAGQTKSNAKVVNGDVLSVSGTFVDSISCIGTPIQDKDWPHIISTIQAWATLADIPPPLAPDPGPSSPQSRFWRTLLADCIPSLHSGVAEMTRIPAVPEVSLSGWFFDAKTRLERGEEPLITPQVHAVWRATHGRRFFCTEKGAFGLCFPHVREGDEAWVLEGGNVPFVLRGVDRDAGALEKRGMVGESYLHGFMDGEAVGSGDLDMAEVLLV
ncbi:hypothetical protein E8E13_002766 [Curvularia kusanoi]|uniref:Heterokaryon incompatibility domain-containing protein n=1 Tax=Curvularia kusanoi TaxID=90978 RepID=A0A9P4T5Z0_CURKU|nr:hypothetical protein E8E13_002766 [Curvularia kusanoi]